MKCSKPFLLNLKNASDVARIRIGIIVPFDEVQRQVQAKMTSKQVKSEQECDTATLISQI